MGNLITIKPDFSEEKTTQAAAILLKLNGGKMNYMKIVKLLYNIDREALLRRCYPITFDDYFSLPHGQILSNTLDMAEKTSSINKTYWDNFIRTNGFDVELIRDCAHDELSRFEINLIEELFEKYKDMDQFDMAKEHHDSDLFPEWEDPGESRIYTDYERLLKILGFSKDDIRVFAEELKDIAFTESLS